MRLGIDVTCRDCGGDLGIVNPGRSNGFTSKAVLGCAACGTEWLLTTQLAPVHDPLTRAGGTKRSSGTIAALTDEARQLVAAGSHVKAACRAVGIDRETYRRHARLRAAAQS